MMIVLLAAGCGGGGGEATVVENAVNVSLVAAETRDIAQDAAYTGVVRGINETKVLPQASGRVTGVSVKAGDYVTRGQVLLTLDSSDYQVGIRSAEAAVATAQAGLAAAEAAKKTNDIRLESAQKTYERALQLHAEGAVSDQELENAKTAYDSLNTGSIEAETARAQAGLLSAQAGLEKARNDINNFTVTAPISGVVGSVSISLGDTAGPQSPVASITDISRLEVDVLVNEGEISYIRKGDPAQVSIEAASASSFPASVDSVGNVPETGKNGYMVKVFFNNANNAVKSGMFAKVYLNTQRKDAALAVPLNAVLSKPGRQVVYIVDEEMRAREVEVTVGIKNKEYVEILSGIQAGQEVIYMGNSLVNEGVLVQVAAGGER
jgi:RND family efflux transporter MFP subunit